MIKNVEKTVCVDTEKVADLVVEKLNKHGRWEVAGKTTHYYICSVCGAPGDCFDKYCRSCGARMDGDEE